MAKTITKVKGDYQEVLRYAEENGFKLRVPVIGEGYNLIKEVQ